MKRFVQIHLLTSYPPSNPNRDDLGRPKTAWMGGVDRLRISSQSLKRAWRTSEIFEAALGDHIGTRTKRLGREVYEKLTNHKIPKKKAIPEEKAIEWSRMIAEKFGKLEKEKIPKQKQGEKITQKDLFDLLDIKQLVHVSVEERQAVHDLADQIAKKQRAPSDDELNLLMTPSNMVDIALFGRMLAAEPKYNVEAACQVAHALSVHPVVVEDDYFTAVDDLNTGEIERGAGHLDESGFAAALMYEYICIDRAQLAQNLDGNTDLVGKAVTALVEAAIKVAPSGKQNSFANRVFASYVLAEKGDQQPRSLSVAFLDPIQGGNYGKQAVDALTQARNQFNKVYGACSDNHYLFNAFEGNGTLNKLLTFVKS